MANSSTIVFTIVPGIIIALILFAYYIAPLIISRTTQNFRVRSISVVSLRGIYVRLGDQILTVERLRWTLRFGWSLRFWRLHLGIEGLELKLPSPSSNDSPTQPLTSSKPSSPSRHHITLLSILASGIRSFISFCVAVLTLLPRSILRAVKAILRPLLRPVFVSCFRIFLSWLPFLSQALELEIDNAVVSVGDVGAYFALAGVSLKAHVELSHLNEDPHDSLDGELESERVREKRLNADAGWRNRVMGSMGRLWVRALAQAHGSASLEVGVVHVALHSTRPILADKATGTPKFAFGRMTPPPSPPKPRGIRKPPSSSIAILLAKPASAKVSLQFTPKLMAIDPYSVRTTVSIPSIDVSLDAISAAIDSLKRGGKSPKMSATLLPPRETSYTGRSKARLVPGRWRAKPRQTLPELFFTILENAELDIGRLKLDRTDPFEPKATVSLSVNDFFVRLGLSDPSHNPLHRTWFGKEQPASDKFDAPVFAFGTGFNKMLVQRIGEDVAEDVNLIKLSEAEIQFISSQYPKMWSQKPRFMSNDPNAALVCCSIHLVDLKITERLDVIQRVLLRSHPTGPIPPTPPSTLFHNIAMPRINFDVHVTNTSVRLLNPDTRPFDGRPSSLNFRSDGISLHGRSEFREPAPSALASKTRVFDFVPSDQNPIRMDFSFEGEVKPISAYLCFSPFEEHDEAWATLSPSSPETTFDFANPPPSSGSDEDLVLRVGNFGMKVVGNALGSFDGDGDGAVTISPSSNVWDVRCFLDDFLIKLGGPRAVHALPQITEYLATKPSSGSLSPPKSLSDRIPNGMTAYFIMPCIRAIVARTDINPDCDQDLSRGVALYTSALFEYAFVQRGQRARRNRYGEARVRDDMSLRKDLAVEASSYVYPLPGTDEVTAIALLTSSPIVCSVFAAGDSAPEDFMRPASPPAKDGKPSSDTIFETSAITTKIQFQKHADPSTKDLTDAIDVIVDVPQVYARAHLHAAYCLLLASRTIESIIPPKPKGPPTLETTTAKANLLLSANVKVATVHLMCNLPESEDIYFRITTLSVKRAAATGDVTADWATLLAWVPSARPSLADKWEECLTLTKWTLEASKLSASTGPEFSVEGEGACIRIPYDYVVAQLITAVTIGAKSIKHLLHSVRADRLLSHPIPPAEDAKSIPSIKIKIVSLTAEGADSPLETNLNLVWRAGVEEQRARLERDLAFEAKVSAIQEEELGKGHVKDAPSSSRWQFSAKHTVSPIDAWRRLQLYNAGCWTRKHRILKEDQERRELAVLRQIRNPTTRIGPTPFIDVHSPEVTVPLFRIVFDQLCLDISKPSFGPSGLVDFLYDLGDGLPRDTEFTLLIPLHLHWTLSSARVSLRDYPLPLISIPPKEDTASESWSFDTDLVIGEEIGPDTNVEWHPCVVVPDARGSPFAKSFTITVPKTTMPVKTYANPLVHVTTPGVTDLAWGVSYQPALQELARLLDTLTHASRDPSPVVGFWDKLRLILHWRARVTFQGEVHFHAKGSRDPYHVVGTGAGFVLIWRDNTTLTIGLSPEAKELIQIQSDNMYLAIPELKHLQAFSGTSSDETDDRPKGSAFAAASSKGGKRHMRKICAKLTNGVRMGVGFAFERACEPGHCDKCTGDEFHRRCRLYTFSPHYKVFLRSAQGASSQSGQPTDSYAGFRSDFVHLSFSLTSPTGTGAQRRGETSDLGHNSLHLSPLAFAHFWSWWSLFNSALSPPIRRGSLFPDLRPPSKKFSRHLATIKYRFSLAPLFICHVYNQDSVAGWKNGSTRCVGIKTKVDSFHADLHQREQAVTKIDPRFGTPTTTYHKPFYAAEVVLTGLELRAVRGLFAEPEKALLGAMHEPETKPEDEDLPTSATADLSSMWVDLDDFTDADWAPTDKQPKLWLLEAGSCPRFTYYKRVHAARPSYRRDGGMEPLEAEVSKFGEEDSHICFLGKEASARQVQIDLALERLNELRHELSVDVPQAAASDDEASSPTAATLRRKIMLLEDYVRHLQKAHPPEHSDESDSDNASRQSSREESFWFMPSDELSAEEWALFVNVYQVHCPKVILNNTTRNVLLDYYYSSRARRGFEYHMSARAVKFLKEQVKMDSQPLVDVSDTNKTPNRAQAVAQNLKRILTREERPGSSEDVSLVPSAPSGKIDPGAGWSEGVTTRSSHYCLLIKPQIVLSSEATSTSILVLSASTALLQSFSILDNEHIDDPVNGDIMSRNYASVRGLQVFAPSDPLDCVRHKAPDHVPLEVLVDYRCESNDFERLVPLTDATFEYDKFNRLRLRNKLSAVAVQGPGVDGVDDHLRNQTDRIIAHVPRFTVVANSQHFGAIYDVVANLLLYSDPSHSRRNRQVESFLYTFDFRDVAASADVVSKLQARIRQLRLVSRSYELQLRQLDDGEKLDLLAVKQEGLMLSEELDTLFEAIKLAQEKGDGGNEANKSALLLQAFSDEIAWNMMDTESNLMAKLSVRGINYSWLNCADSSTQNSLRIDDLQALNCAPNALFPEMLVKYDKPSQTSMESFAQSSWRILPPVGGISIIEAFELNLHPIRLQIERRTGRRIMEYIFPHRQSKKHREVEGLAGADPHPQRSHSDDINLHVHTAETASADSSFADHSDTEQPKRGGLNRSASSKSHRTSPVSTTPAIRKVPSSDTLRAHSRRPKASRAISDIYPKGDVKAKDEVDMSAGGDAAVMRERASHNRTFVLINVSSLVFVLSYKRDTPLSLTTVPDLDDFKFRTPGFQYYNRTWSFEELVEELKHDVYRAAWQQKGALIKEVFTKAKFVTPRKFLGSAEKKLPRAPRREGTQSSVSSSASTSTATTTTNSTSSLSTLTAKLSSGKPKKKWAQVFHSTNFSTEALSSRGLTALNTERVVLDASTPLTASPVSETEGSSFAFPTTNNDTPSHQTELTRPRSRLASLLSRTSSRTRKNSTPH